MEKAIEVIKEEAERINFGKLHLEILVQHGKIETIKMETERQIKLELLRD